MTPFARIVMKERKARRLIVVGVDMAKGPARTFVTVPGFLPVDVTDAKPGEVIPLTPVPHDLNSGRVH